MTTGELMAAIDAVTERIVRGFSPERIILFGSCAAGTERKDSDVDLLIVMPVEQSTRRAACAIDAALDDRMFPLDVVVLTPAQFAEQRNRYGTIAYEAAHQGKVLYERVA